jgi:hypothetical protein
MKSSPFQFAHVLIHHPLSSDIACCQLLLESEDLLFLLFLSGYTLIVGIDDILFVRMVIGQMLLCGAGVATVNIVDIKPAKGGRIWWQS